MKKTTEPMAAMPRTLTVDEAAAVLRVRPDLLLRNVNQPHWPRAVKVGRKWRIAERELVRFVGGAEYR
jgi:excisionase family DNA binding protein